MSRDINGGIMKKIIAILLIITMLALAGCKKPTVAPTVEVEAEPTGVAAEVSEDISDVGTLDEDLDVSDLDDLEKELEGLDW